MRYAWAMGGLRVLVPKVFSGLSYSVRSLLQDPHPQLPLEASHVLLPVQGHKSAVTPDSGSVSHPRRLKRKKAGELVTGPKF